MTLPVVWLPEAQAELMEAVARYDAIRPELGERFANAVVETAEAIAATPVPTTQTRLPVRSKPCSRIGHPDPARARRPQARIKYQIIHNVDLESKLVHTSRRLIVGHRNSFHRAHG